MDGGMNFKRRLTPKPRLLNFECKSKPDMDRFEISVRPFLTVLYRPNHSAFSPFLKSRPFFRTSPFLRTKNTLEIFLFHHSLASSSSLSGCFRLRNSASNTLKLTFANKMFSKFLSLVLRRLWLKMWRISRKDAPPGFDLQGHRGSDGEAYRAVWTFSCFHARILEGCVKLEQDQDKTEGQLQRTWKTMRLGAEARNHQTTMTQWTMFLDQLKEHPEPTAVSGFRELWLNTEFHSSGSTQKT